MGNKRVVYIVVVYTGQGEDRAETRIYETRKREKADQYLFQYLRQHSEVDGAYIDKVYEDHFDKRKWTYDEEY